MRWRLSTNQVVNHAELPHQRRTTGKRERGGRGHDQSPAIQIPLLERSNQRGNLPENRERQHSCHLIPSSKARISIFEDAGQAKSENERSYQPKQVDSHAIGAERLFRGARGIEQLELLADLAPLQIGCY